MSGPFADDPASLSDEARRYYKGMRDTHRNDEGTGKCKECDQETCSEFAFALAVLTAGGIS